MTMTRELVLATDLDGTFLGGSVSERRRLFECLKAHGRFRLIFVTGRGIETVLPVLNDPFVPQPDYIIADVGATVVRGEDREPIIPLQTDIAANWPGTATVLHALAPFGALQRQEVPQERRCSFFVEENGITDPLRAVVAELGCDLLFSAGRYLDVLPGGVTKGTTLQRLMEQEGIAPESVVVAGDTLNDLSLFETGLQGVVVGAAEPALVEAVAALPNVHVAAREGAGGILEGLVSHGFLPPEEAQIEEDSTPAGPLTGDASLVMVYHRLPFDEVAEPSGVVRRRPLSPNGIIPTLLGFFAHVEAGSWVAWSAQKSRHPAGFEPHVPVDPEKYPGLVTARIPLTTADVELFYKRFSKEAFWPIIFSFPDKGDFRADHFQHYVEINRIFAERAAREAAPGALVWVHDYNLWLVPGVLRQLRPDVRIAFFHHTAFPPPDVFNVLPWRREILGSLCACDYVGFHVPRYAVNFVDTVASYAPTQVLREATCAPRFMTFGCALGVARMPTAIEVGGRTVRVGAHPVGIDLDHLATTLARPSAQESIARIRRELDGRRMILSIERLDYVKGPLEKLLAFERLLENHPEHHRKIVMVNVVTPPAPGMEVYESVREDVDRIVGRINGRFSKLDWTPVRYFFRSLPYEDVLAFYAASDVAWITPLRDGLNLVAKEYIATKAVDGSGGALVISEFAGAAVELQGALLTNPYDVADMETVLNRALSLDPADRDYRLRRLVDIVRANDVRRWGEEFMSAAREGGP